MIPFEVLTSREIKIAIRIYDIHSRRDIVDCSREFRGLTAKHTTSTHASPGFAKHVVRAIRVFNTGRRSLLPYVCL